MSTTTVRIPEDLRDALKIIASVEKRNIKEILSELIGEYLDRHKQILEILSGSEWINATRKGSRSSEKGEVVRRRKKMPGK